MTLARCTLGTSYPQHAFPLVRREMTSLVYHRVWDALTGRPELVWSERVRVLVHTLVFQR